MFFGKTSLLGALLLLLAAPRLQAQPARDTARTKTARSGRLEVGIYRLQQDALTQRGLQVQIYYEASGGRAVLTLQRGQTVEQQWPASDGLAALAEEQLAVREFTAEFRGRPGDPVSAAMEDVSQCGPAQTIRTGTRVDATIRPRKAQTVEIAVRLHEQTTDVNNPCAPKWAQWRMKQTVKESEGAVMQLGQGSDRYLVVIPKPER